MNDLDVRVHAIRLAAEGIHMFELRAKDRGLLPAFTAGSHVEVHMTGGLARSYSLANAPGDTERYVIAVHKDPSGRGGSRYMHDEVRVGQLLRIGAPRNNFELDERAPHTVLIAGGIGITPLRAMVARLRQIKRPWTLYYCGRERAAMAYEGEFAALATDGADVNFHVDNEVAGAFLDLRTVVRSVPLGAHFYCCGPKPMLAAFEEATVGLPPDRVHVEYFSAKEEAAVEGDFSVELARSGRTVLVAPGKSILDAVLDAGVKVDFSCMEGICGSCETRVLAGVPDHRDSVLSKADREANDRMLICCSGAKSPSITLDL